MLRVITRIPGFTGGPYIHVSYWVGADTAPGAVAANSAVGAFWGSMASLMSISLTATTDPQVAQMDPVTGTRTANFTVTPVTHAGTDAGDPLPPATQALGQLLTGSFIAGRELRGRINIPGWTETNSTAGRPASSALTTLNSALATLNGATSPDLAVWSRKHGTAVAVTATSAWTLFAVRRSRRD